MTKLHRPSALRLAALATLMLLPVASLNAQQQAACGPSFEIRIETSARAEPVTGRVYVAISRIRDTSGTPIERAGENGDPLFGRNVENLTAGKTAVIDANDFGHPVQSLRDLPAGEYRVQPFVNVYTKFARADGHTVWLHMDQWEGQQWKTSPGNIYGAPVRITWNPKSGTPIKLVADKVIPPIAMPADEPYVKRFRMESAI